MKLQLPAFMRRKPNARALDPLAMERALQIILSNPAMIDAQMGRAFSASEAVAELDQNFDKFLQSLGLFDDVTSCIDAIAVSAAAVPVQLQEIGGDIVENPPDHIAEWLIQPNPDQGVTEWWLSAHTQLGFTGECPLLGVTESGEYEISDRTSELWVQDASKFGPVLSKRDGRAGREAPQITGWALRLQSGESMRFPAEAAILAREPHPRDPIRGLSTIKKLEWKLAWLYGALVANKAYHAKGSFPGLLITSDRKYDADMEKAFEAKFGESTQGVRNIGSVLWAWATGIKAERLLDAPKDALQMDVILHCRDAIRAAYKVPPLMLAGVEDANRSNSDGQMAVFWRNAVMPRNKLILDALNRSAFVPDGMRLVHDYSGVEALQPNRNEQMERAVAGWQGGILMLNEAREELGREPVPDGEKFYEPPAPPPPDDADDDADDEFAGLGMRMNGHGKLGRLEIDL